MLTLLDQRRLPREKIYLDYDNPKAVADAITAMVVRGAPAIGIAAAYAVVLAARKAYAEVGERWRELIEEDMPALPVTRNQTCSRRPSRFITMISPPTRRWGDWALP